MSPDKTKEPNLPWEPPLRDARRSHLEEQYPVWVRANRLRARDARRMREEASGFRHRPPVSLLLTVHNQRQVPLERTLDSVLDQIYPHWELLVCDAADQEAKAILSFYGRLDERIKMIPSNGDGSVTAGMNAALSTAEGEIVGFLKGGDELAPDAPFEVTKLLQEHPGADMIYSDHDEIDGSGERANPCFKPGWSPELLLSTDYLSPSVLPEERS